MAQKDSTVRDRPKLFWFDLGQVVFVQNIVILLIQNNELV